MRIAVITFEHKYKNFLPELNNISSEGQLAKYNRKTNNKIFDVESEYLEIGGGFWLAVEAETDKVVGMVGLS